MDVQRFTQLVDRYERESRASPGLYKARVVVLTLLGFGLLALLFGAAGLGIVLLAGLLVAILYTGGGALFLLLKLGKLAVFLALPMWFLVKAGVQALFVRLPAPQGRDITRAEAPVLFAALDRMRQQMRGPRFHKVLVVDDVNAAVVQRPAFGLIGWPRNHLLLGLPLLEAMPPDEALAVVAHEYGHLAGAHGRFGAYIYRLRNTWGTVQAFAEQIPGWLASLVKPLVRGYAPYFNACTFVLARANEYQADAASAELVGRAQAMQALKRVNTIAPQHQRFLEQTFERVADDPVPPPDLMHRWAAQAVQPPAPADALRWLGDALDRAGQVTDTHPTLRARLAALSSHDAGATEPPPPLQGPSAAQAWLGPLAERLRAELQARWATQVADAWSQRHAEAQQRRQRLAELRALPERDMAQQIELLRLAMDCEPLADHREALAAFNAAHADHPLGLFLEGSARLQHDDEAGLPLLERAMALDPEATKPACERVHAFLAKRQQSQAAEAYAERWRQRQALELARSFEWETVNPQHALASHGLDAATLAALKALLTGPALKHVTGLWLARRVLPADPTVVRLILGVQLSRWGRFRDKGGEVLRRLAALQSPVAMELVTLDGQFAKLAKKFKALPDARLV